MLGILRSQRKALDGFLAIGNEVRRAARLDAEIKSISEALAQPREGQRDFEQRGWLIEWPVPGGRRDTLWSMTDSAAKAIGCPHQPVFVRRAHGIGKQEGQQP